jgi:hypothetical protein
MDMHNDLKNAGTLQLEGLLGMRYAKEVMIRRYEGYPVVKF